MDRSFYSIKTILPYLKSTRGADVQGQFAWLFWDVGASIFLGSGLTYLLLTRECHGGGISESRYTSAVDACYVPGTNH